MKTGLPRFGMILIMLAFLLSACASSQVVVPTSTSVSSPATAEQIAQPTEALPSTSSGTATAGATAAASPAATTASGGASAAPTGALKFVIVPEKSEARYRVREQLANVKLPNDAIGKTNSISGALVIQPDGTIVSPDSKFTVDLASLQTDRSMRDNFVRRSVLGTDQYPQAVFVPTSVSGLSAPLPQSGEFKFQLTGDLTIRDVTKPVTWDVTGKIENGVITAQAVTSFKFGDFNLTQPRVPVVLSIEDNITLELDLTLQPATS